MSKFHPEATLAQIAPELLPKQHLDIRFIIDHEDEKIHRCAPIASKSKDALRHPSP
ncbi:MAG: hypothetical protein WBL48_03110 [Pseudolabrys sp.]